MRIVSRINNNVLNSKAMATMVELAKVFNQAPNMAAKTIRLYPWNSISMFTEGLGEIYNINAKSDNFIGINKNGYKWKIRGHQVPKVKAAARTTGGAISSGDSLGAGGQSFTVAFDSSYYNPRDIIKLESGQLLYSLSEGTFIKEGHYEYLVKHNGPQTESISGALLQPGKETGLKQNLISSGFMKRAINILLPEHN